MHAGRESSQQGEQVAGSQFRAKEVKTAARSKYIFVSYIERNIKDIQQESRTSKASYWSENKGESLYYTAIYIRTHYIRKPKKTLCEENKVKCRGNFYVLAKKIM